MDRKIKQEVVDPLYIKKEHLSPVDAKRVVKIEKRFSSPISHNMSDSESCNDQLGLDSDTDSSQESSLDADSETSDRPGRPVGKTRPSPSRVTSSKPNLASIPTRLSVLESVVSAPAEFDTVQDPGPLTIRDMKQDNEYYIFRFLRGMVNPNDLVNTKIRVGGKESRQIEVKNKSFEVSTYESSPMADTPTLFVPDELGTLRQVDFKISGHVLIKESPSNSVNTQQIDINGLRARVHNPPEIRERNFFGTSGAISQGKKTPLKKSKLPKDKKRLSVGKKRLSVGKKRHSEGEKRLSEGEKRLSEGEKRLSVGKKRLSKGNTSFADGKKMDTLTPAKKKKRSQRSMSPQIFSLNSD